MRAGTCVLALTALSKCRIVIGWMARLALQGELKSSGWDVRIYTQRL